MKQIGVVLITYNPEFSSLISSLNSIINQKQVDYELIISDDGSKIDFFNQIELFLLENNFYDFKIIRHETNQGTVRNFLDGVDACDAEYIKGLGQGDMLFNDEALHSLYNYAKDNRAELCISKYVNFKIANNEVSVLSKIRFPQCDKAYCNANKLKKYYLLYGDVVSGVSTCYLKSTLIKYLNEIQGKVLYSEDMLINLMVYDECRLVYYRQNTVWYENGNGISQRHNEIWKQRIGNDWNEMVKMLILRCNSDFNIKFSRLLKKRIKAYMRFKEEPNFYNHLQYLMSIPGIIPFIFIKKVWCKYTDTDVTKDSIRRYKGL